jgi:hypothetical protein
MPILRTSNYRPLDAPIMAPQFFFQMDEFEPHYHDYHQSDLPSPRSDTFEQLPWKPYDTSDIYDFGYSPISPPLDMLSRLPQCNVMTYGYSRGWGCSDSDSDTCDLENLTSILAPIQAPPVTSDRPVCFIAHSLGGLLLANSISECNTTLSGTYARHGGYAKHNKIISSGNADRNHDQEFGPPQHLSSWHCSTCSSGLHDGQVKLHNTGKGYQSDEESGIVRDVPDYGNCRQCIKYKFNDDCGCNISWCDTME